MLVVLKIGTESIVGNFDKIVNDIVSAKKNGHDIILVSSGAFGIASNLDHKCNASFYEKRVVTGIGQYMLMTEYANAFQKYSYFPSQILLTATNFRIKKTTCHLKKILKTMLSKKNIIPIINENDILSFDGNSFVDNDELASMLSFLIKPDKLIILTNVDGVYDKFESENKKIIPVIKLGDIIKVSSVKGTLSRGGMLNKVKIGKKLAKRGIETIICNANIADVIIKVINNSQIGTKFIPKSI